MDVIILFRVLARDSSISITREIFHIISIKSAFRSAQNKKNYDDQKEGCKA